MAKKGVKAVYSDDKKTVTTWAYPSKSGYDYKLQKKTWKNECPLCTKVSHFKKKGKLKFNPKGTDEGELTCEQCGADFCAVSGQDKNVKIRGKLTPATVTPNKSSKVAGSQTKSQKCSLSKAEALAKAKSILDTKSEYKGTLQIPVMKNIHLGDLVNINLKEFPATKKKSLYIDSIKEDIDNQTLSINLLEGKTHFPQEYEGSYVFKNKNGAIIGNKNPLNAKCSKVNVNIGLKDNSTIGKKIKLKGQELGTVAKIYKWLRIKSGGGTGGWKYKKWGNHYYKSEPYSKFGSKSAEYCWSNKTANCCDFAWIMAKMGEGAGKKIGIQKGTYDSANGTRKGHMWNYSGTKYYDCSSATDHTIDFKKVEKVK